MPFIYITSLPMADNFDVGVAVRDISRRFSERTSVSLEHITVTWQFLNPKCYAVSGKVANKQGSNSHPILMDLLAPDFNSAEKIEVMLRAAADGITEASGIDKRNIFINFRAAHAGQVFDAGDIVSW